MTPAKRPSWPSRRTPWFNRRTPPESSPLSPVESNARVLSSHKQLEVIDAHTAVYRVSYSKRILTYAGKIREAEVKIDYNPACQEARLLRAAVISKSGQRQEIAKGEINVMDAGWNASAKRYTGGKILVANLPGVDLGSTIEVEFEITSKDRPFVAGFEAFQLPDELEHKSFELTAPTYVQIVERTTCAPALIQEQTATNHGKQVFQWTVRKRQSPPGGEPTAARMGLISPGSVFCRRLWAPT